MTWNKGDIVITDKSSAPPIKQDPKRDWIDPMDSEDLGGENRVDKAGHEAGDINDLLLEIARCSNFKSKKGNHCKTIVQTQPQEDYQLPEPWSGDLQNAPILFLSSNPSISSKEKYPRHKWPDDEIIDFFSHRFGGGLEGWTKDGRYTLLKAGSVYSNKGVRYWASARKRAIELLCKNDVQPGVDYTFSEVVHCKSLHEKGVSKALPECAGRYLKKIVACSGARIIVCFGRFTPVVVRQVFGIPDDVNVSAPVQVGSRLRIFTFMPHPNAWMVHSFTKCLSASELERLRSWLRESKLELSE
jgi:hypothetical protein